MREIKNIPRSNESEETDKDRFMAFVNGLNKIKLNQITEDWGDMHGVTISTDYSGTMNTTICFNFYNDGAFRAIIDTSDENKYLLFWAALRKELKHMGFWRFFKMWRKARCGT